jgi:MFS family permease
MNGPAATKAPSRPSALARARASTLRRLDREVGGPARRRVVVLLALTLALDAADKATLGAVAAELQQSLGVTNLQLGVLASASLGVAGIATLPIGLLTDRVNRVRLLVISIVGWAAALVVAGASTSFAMLLFARLGLGIVGATAGPTLASLVGDYFPARDRGRAFGYVLTGELIGAGFGFIAAGEITAVTSWRWGFWILVVPAAVMAWALARHLPEPARGGASRIPEGAEEIPTEAGGAPADDEDAGLTLAQEVAEEEDVEPVEPLVLHDNPTRMRFRDAVRYVLSVRTNRVLIIASALGWFFFSGVRTFAVLFLRGHFGVGQAAATGLLALIGAGALIGVLIGGRASDAVIARGRLNGRVIVAFIAYSLTPLLLAPGIATTTLAVGLPLLVAGSLTLGAANPPVDAGRLDVMHHRLWGRAEGVRTLFRTWAEASGPIVFGLVSQLLGPAGATAPFAAQGAAQSGGASGTQGLEYAFLVMLAPLAAGAFIGLRARHSYPSDVATAAESERHAQEDS